MVIGVILRLATMCVFSCCGFLIHGKGTATARLRLRIVAKRATTSNPVPWRSTGFDATTGEVPREAMADGLG